MLEVRRIEKSPAQRLLNHLWQRTLQFVQYVLHRTVIYKSLLSLQRAEPRPTTWTLKSNDWQSRGRRREEIKKNDGTHIYISLFLIFTVYIFTWSFFIFAYINYATVPNGGFTCGTALRTIQICA